MASPSAKSDKDWKSTLTPEQYRVLREGGTEAPFSGKLLHNKEAGTYACAACGAPLFKSETKFDSGCGWPSFYEPLTPEAVELLVDDSLGMVRTEVRCAACGSHLGHVFDDGPRPTGQRYCMNSVSLDFDSRLKGG
jgi:peptide-methionine (R)-S-oxide reductase